MQNTTESNKIIAEFIGLKLPTGCNCMVEVRGDIKTDLLAFDTDWNQLFKAIDKIESLGYWVELSSSEIMSLCEIGLVNDETAIVSMATNTKIKAAYNAVVEFIIEYNKKK